MTIVRSRTWLLVGLFVAVLLGLAAHAHGSEPATHAAPTRNFSFPWPRQQQWYYTGAPHSHPGAPVLGSGLDFAPAPDSTLRPVVAMADGRVLFAGMFDPAGYGNVVAVDHGDGWVVWYAHLASIAVRPGQHVLKGRYLGEAGSTGFSTGVHVHLELFHHGRRARWEDVTIDGWRPVRLWDYVGYLERDGLAVWVQGYGAGGPLQASSPLILGCSPLDSEFAVNLVYFGYVTGGASPQDCPPPPDLTGDGPGGL